MHSGPADSAAQQESDKQNMTEEELKLSYFKTEPIPDHILERMDACRRKGMIVPDETLIKRPSQIEGIREASRINTLVLDEKILREITDEEEKEIVSAFNIMAQNSDIKTPRSKTGVDNLCVVFAVVSKDGKVIYSKVIS